MKSSLNLYILLLCSLSFLYFSCSEGTVTDDFDLEMGFEYYPLEVGQYHIYEVDSTTYNPEGSGIEQLSSKTFVKEEIIDFSIDNVGDTIYVIERYEKKDLAAEWEIRDVWSTKVYDNRAEKTEENLKLIKMIFPLQEGLDFSATLFIDDNTSILVAGETIDAFKNWNSEIQQVGVAESIGTYSFDEVTTINYADDENLIEKRFAQSKFAKGVGLVYSEEWILDTQCLADCEGQSWEDKAEKGYILRQTLLEYN